MQANLLRSGLLTGVALISRYRKCEYAQGDLRSLEHAPPEVLQQFTAAFGHRVATAAGAAGGETDDCRARSFTVPSAGDGPDRVLHVYYQTPSSCYVAARGRQRGGLLACSLPYGVLLCSHAQPFPANQVATLVEGVADKLRL